MYRNKHNSAEITAVPVENFLSGSSPVSSDFAGTVPGIAGFSRFNRYYEKLSLSLLKEYASTDHSLLFSYQYEQLSADLISVTLSCFRSAYSRTTLLFFDGCVWNRRSGFPASLSSFCVVSKRKLLRFLRSSVSQRIGTEGFCCYPDWERKLPHYWNWGQFYYSDDHIYLYFQPDTLSPIREGSPRFMLPPSLQK